MATQWEDKIREQERQRLREEWDATQENKENQQIDVEDLKQQEDMKQGNYLETREMDKIYADDKSKNKEFDETVSGGTLEDLRKGVKIRQKENNYNPIQDITNQAKSWDTHRQGFIDKSSQAVDNIVTGSLKRINMPGAEFIGDRSRNISGCVTDIAIPEAWELPLLSAGVAAAGADGPLPVGDAFLGLKYGQGIGSRLYRKGVKVLKHPATHLTNIGADAWQKLVTNVENVFSLTRRNGEYITPEGIKVNPKNFNDVFATTTKSGGSGPTIPSFGQTFVPPNPSEIHKVTQKLLNENVLYGKERRFNYNAFKGLYTGKGGSKKARQLEILMQTTPHSKIPNWNTHRQGLVDVFESLYGDVMSLKGITRKRIHIDHLVTLRSTMPIYDDVAFGSPLWNQIQETLLNSKKKYKPGNTLDNLNALDPGSHTVKTNFFNDRLGKDGELFFTKKRIAYMKKSDANRMEVLNDFIAIQDEGTEILNEATQVWETIYKPGTVLPQQIVEKLAKIPVGKYSHPELKNLDELKRIVDDIVVAEGDIAIKNINKGYKLLSDRIQDPNLKMRVKQPPTLEKKLEKLGRTEGITKDTAQRNLFGPTDDILSD